LRIYTDKSSVAQRSTATTSTAEITSLPVSAISGSRLDAEIRGNTVVNVLADAVAGCEDATNFTGTNATLADDTTNKISGTNCMKITLTDTSGTADYDVLSKLFAGRYFLLSAYIKNGTATNINMSLETDDQDVTTAVVTATSYTRVGVVIAPTDFDAASSAVIRFTVTGANAQTAFVDNIMLQEITSTEYALGASALLLKKAFHLGTKSTDRVIVKSVGKNLFDKSKVEYGYATNSANGALTVNASFCTSAFIRVQPSTTYYKTTNNNYCEYDINKNFIGFSSGLSFTTSSNCAFIRTHLLLTAIDTFQFEKASTATTYAAFTQTSAIVPVELKKVSATIYDVFEGNEGKHTKNTEKDTDVSGAQYTSHDTTTYTNVDVTKTTAFSLAVAGTTGADAKTLVIDKNGKILEEVTQANIDLVASVGKYYYHTDKSVWFITAADTYADIAAARTGLGTSQVFYQLATPVVTNYYPNIINAEPSGTVYVYPFVEDYDFYNGGVYINNTSYPIDSLEYVYIVNKATGTLTPVAISTCTVAAGGASFTSTAISTGDLVSFGYTHKDLSTVADLYYQYDLNLTAAIEDNSKSIRDLDDKLERAILAEKARIMIAPITIGAVSATTSMISFIAPAACELVGFQIATKDAIAANDTDYWTIALTDKGSDGSASNAIASKTTMSTGGTAFAAYDMWDIGALDATHRQLAEGDVVLLTFTKSASATAFAEARSIMKYALV
jgi:hypothetical protein